jgi:DHA3 family tetracycline resistance protein-like MFS transporter
MSLPAHTPASRGLGVLRPLRNRDFALLWSGFAISLLGDGIYLVAIAWQAYDLSNTPTSLAVVGAAWTLPTVLLLLAGGVLSDRFDRRVLMMVADALRALAIGAVGALSLAGVLELWHLLVLVAIYGVGDALFHPAASAITPSLVPRDQLMEANALEHFVRPLAGRFAGPALGGVLVATAGPGTCFAIDAATFVVSAICIAAIRLRPVQAEREDGRSVITDVREGLAFVRSKPWLWATLAAVALSLLAYYGPRQVLLPFRLKNELGLGAGTFGAVVAAGGAGSMTGALAIGQFGLPRRFMTWMYLGWALATLELVLFAFAGSAWQFMGIALAGGLAETVGNVTWGTLMGSRVPPELLGRVSSVDWQVSIALIPVSFALAGPIGEALGTKATLIGAGLLGTIATVALLAVPGVRDPEREPADQPSSVPG